MQLENFSDAWKLTNFPRAFTISLLVTVVTVAGAGDPELAGRLRDRAQLGARSCSAGPTSTCSRRCSSRSLSSPCPRSSSPRYSGLDNPAGVALLHILFGLSFNVLLYSAFLRSIPYELEESARLDGATTWQVFWKLMFPLLAPMNATVGIFAFLASWNDFMMPSLITVQPGAADPAGHPEPLPDPVQLQLQHRVRVLPDGHGPHHRRLPVRPALGHVRRHPRRHQVAARHGATAHQRRRPATDRVAPASRPRLVAPGGGLPDLPAQLRRRQRRRDRRPAGITSRIPYLAALGWTRCG